MSFATSPPGETAQAPGAAGWTRAGRRPIPFAWFAFIAPATMVYTGLASLNPIINQSALAIALIALLFLIITSFILMSTNADPLDPFRVASVYFLMCFCISPLFILDPYWHFAGSLGSLAEKALAYLIVGYLMMAAGYYLPIFRPIPRVIRIGEFRGNESLAKVLAIALFVIGQICLLIVFVRAGGVGTIIGGDESRNVFLRGLGIFFWPALFAFSGGVLYFAMKARPNVRLAWLHSWPLWITAASWVVFQSRMKVLNVLVMGLLLSHYLIRPLRVPRLALFGALGFTFAVVVGFARNPSNRFLLVANPGLLFGAMYEHFWDFAHAILVGSFSRLRQIMLIFDKVPSWTPHDWGSSFLMVFNPVFRLVGLEQYASAGIGPRLFGLAHPDIAGTIQTGYLASLPGEFLFNFPFYIAIFLFPVYGIVLRVAYSRLILRDPDPGSVALYAILLLALVNMIFASVGQNLFEVLVLTLPPFAVVTLARMGSGGRASVAPAVRAPP